MVITLETTVLCTICSLFTEWCACRILHFLQIKPQMGPCSFVGCGRDTVGSMILWNFKHLRNVWLFISSQSDHQTHAYSRLHLNTIRRVNINNRDIVMIFRPKHLLDQMPSAFVGSGAWILPHRIAPQTASRGTGALGGWVRVPRDPQLRGHLQSTGQRNHVGR